LQCVPFDAAQTQQSFWAAGRQSARWPRSSLRGRGTGTRTIDELAFFFEGRYREGMQSNPRSLIQIPGA
jgi:hypothetical protein